MKTALRKMGNSQGIIIPKTLIAQLGLQDEVEMTITPQGIMLSKPSAPARAGWAEASRQLAAAGDDALAWPEFPNEDDETLTW